MKHLTSLIIAAILPMTACLMSCEKDSVIGSSIVEDQITVTVDSSFTVVGSTVEIGKIQSRTTNQLIGRIEAKGYGRLASDVVTQFMPASQLDTENIKVENIDSLLLVMSIAKNEFIGDSVAPLGINVYPLKRQLPSPIYSDFNPEDYYSPDEMIASTIYNVSNNSAGYVNKEGYTSIVTKLPLSLAKSLYEEYLRNPSTYASPTAFAEFFPGFYIKNSFGSGRFSRVTSTLMSMYYHYTYTNPDTGRDSVITRNGNYFAVTPEIITNNNISMEISPEISQRIAEGQHIVLGPAGLEVRIKFPALDIISAYNKGNNSVRVLNTLSFSVPGAAIENNLDIQPPTYLLLVLEKDKDKFFANNSLPDNVTSFYATYNTTTGIYSFGDMRQYILSLMAQDEIKEEDYTFVITPVSAVFESNSSSLSSYYYYGTSSSSQTLTMLTPYCASPVMGTLYLSKAKIRLTFSTQSVTK